MCDLIYIYTYIPCYVIIQKHVHNTKSIFFMLESELVLADSFNFIHLILGIKVLGKVD